jgi:hypothetical protein
VDATSRAAWKGCATVLVAHVVQPGDGVGLLFVAAAALFGLMSFAMFDSDRERPARRRLATGAAVACGACVICAYLFPLAILKPTQGRVRPSATARLEMLSPRPGELFRGDPASVTVQLRLVGGSIVATSAKIEPDVGHVHVYLDGDLVSMAPGLLDRLDVKPGTHELRVEFVAGDHGPFNPPVQASVSFRVEP